MANEAILVVDDHPENIRLIELLLRSEGYRLTTAASAEEAWERVRSSPPRLILMDIQLPGKDGLQLTREIKADPATRDIIVLAFTSYAMRGDREKALAAGCDGYITKPIDTRTLPGVIAAHLSGNLEKGKNK